MTLIVRVNIVLNRTVVVDSDWHFENLCGSHLQSQSELYHASWWYYILVIDLIGQLCRDVIGHLSVKPWCYWLWKLTLTLKMTTAQLVETSVTVNNNSPIHDYVQPDDQTKLIKLKTSLSLLLVYICTHNFRPRLLIVFFLSNAWFSFSHF